MMNVTHCQPLFVSTVFSLVMCLAAGNVQADPLPLDDVALDSIDGGYVHISIEAFAAANGVNTAAVTMTNTDVRPLRNSRRHAYTVATADGFAFAAGETVQTNIQSMFDTDEQIMKVKVKVRERIRRGGAALARRLGIPVPEGVQFERMELRKVRIRVVTRVRLP